MSTSYASTIRTAIASAPQAKANPCCSSSHAAAPSDAALQSARAAMQAGPAAARALVRRAAFTHDLDLAAAILHFSVVQHTKSPVPRTARTRSTHAGCHLAPFSSRHDIKFPSKHAGITIGWERVTVSGYCWDRGDRRGNITRTGRVYATRYSAAPYCWKDTQSADNLLPGWGRRAHNAFAYGVLGGNAVFGCAGLQTVVVGVDYFSGGAILRY